MPFSIRHKSVLAVALCAAACGDAQVQGGRQPPKVPTLISIDMVRTAVKSQDRLDASYQPVRDGRWIPTIVERLLDAGTDVNKPNDHGFTPLVIAAQYAPIVVVRRRLARGADPCARDDDGAAAYNHADWARPDREETVRILREAAREREREPVSGVAPLSPCSVD